MDYIHYTIDILLILAFIADRVFRLRSIKEYKEAKDAQIENLKQQLDAERHSNDVEITELHKKRYENLKLILDEKELEINNSHIALLELQTAFQENGKKDELIKKLLEELNRLERKKQETERERVFLLRNEPPVIRMRDRVKI
jgi:folylpolyglutamate synthase/dihydropteroate synthase